MHTTCLKYRLLPTPAQETLLGRTLSVCRDVYNSLLNERKHDYELHGASPSRYEQQKHFPAWSKEFPEVAGVVHQTARRLVNRFGLIAVERLNTQNMQGNRCFAKSIADAS